MPLNDGTLFPGQVDDNSTLHPFQGQGCSELKSTLDNIMAAIKATQTAVIGNGSPVQITDVNFQPTGNPDEYTTVTTWIDSNGVTQVTTDTTPVIIPRYDQDTFDFSAITAQQMVDICTQIIANCDITTDIQLNALDPCTLELVDGNGDVISTQNIGFTVNAGTTALATDDANGTAGMCPTDTLHFWSSDSTVDINVSEGSAIVDLTVDAGIQWTISDVTTNFTTDPTNDNERNQHTYRNFGTTNVTATVATTHAQGTVLRFANTGTGTTTIDGVTLVDAGVTLPNIVLGEDEYVDIQRQTGGAWEVVNRYPTSNDSGTVLTANTAFTSTNMVDVEIGMQYVEFPDGTTFANDQDMECWMRNATGNNNAIQPAGNGLFLIQNGSNVWTHSELVDYNDTTGQYTITTQQFEVKIVANFNTLGTGNASRVYHWRDVSTAVGTVYGVAGVFGQGSAEAPATATIPPNTTITLDVRSVTSGNNQELQAGSFVQFCQQGLTGEQADECLVPEDFYGIFTSNNPSINPFATAANQNQDPLWNETRGDVTVAGGTITHNSGTAWIATAITDEQFNSIIATPGTEDQAFFIGLTRDNTVNAAGFGFAQLDFGIYYNGNTDEYSIWEDGALVQNHAAIGSPVFSSASNLEVRVNQLDATVEYLINDEIVFTSTQALNMVEKPVCEVLNTLSGIVAELVNEEDPICKRNILPVVPQNTLGTDFVDAPTVGSVIAPDVFQDIAPGNTVGDTASLDIDFLGLNDHPIPATVTVERINGTGGEVRLNTNGRFSHSTNNSDFIITLQLKPLCGEDIALPIALNASSILVNSEGLFFDQGTEVTGYAQGAGGVNITLPYTGQWSNNNNNAASGLSFDAANSISFRKNGISNAGSQFTFSLLDVLTVEEYTLCETLDKASECAANMIELNNQNIPKTIAIDCFEVNTPTIVAGQNGTVDIDEGFGVAFNTPGNFVYTNNSGGPITFDTLTAYVVTPSTTGSTTTTLTYPAGGDTTGIVNVPAAGQAVKVPVVLNLANPVTVANGGSETFTFAHFGPVALQISGSGVGPSNDFGLNGLNVELGMALIDTFSQITCSNGDVEVRDSNGDVVAGGLPAGALPCEAPEDIDTFGTVVTATAALTTTNGVNVALGGFYVLFPDGTTWSSDENQEPVECYIDSVGPLSNALPGGVPVEQFTETFTPTVTDDYRIFVQLEGYTGGNNTGQFLFIGTTAGASDVFNNQAPTADRWTDNDVHEIIVNLTAGTEYFFTGNAGGTTFSEKMNVKVECPAPEDIDTFGTVVTATVALTTTNGVDIAIGEFYTQFPDGTTWSSNAGNNTPSTLCKSGISVGKTFAEIQASSTGGTGVAGEDNLTSPGDHYIMYTDTAWGARGFTGLAAPNTDHFVLVVDQAGAGLQYGWGANNLSPFTLAPTDVLVAQITTAGAATPFASDGEITLGDGSTICHAGNLGGLTITPDQFNGAANAGEMDITAGDFAFSKGGTAQLQLDGTYLDDQGATFAAEDAAGLGWGLCPLATDIDTFGDVITATAVLTTTNGVNVEVGDQHVQFPNGTTWASTPGNWLQEDRNATGAFTINDGVADKVWRAGSTVGDATWTLDSTAYQPGARIIVSNIWSNTGDITLSPDVLGMGPSGAVQVVLEPGHNVTLVRQTSGAWMVTSQHPSPDTSEIFDQMEEWAKQPNITNEDVVVNTMAASRVEDPDGGFRFMRLATPVPAENRTVKIRIARDISQPHMMILRSLRAGANTDLQIDIDTGAVRKIEPNNNVINIVSTHVTSEVIEIIAEFEGNNASNGWDLFPAVGASGQTAYSAAISGHTDIHCLDLNYNPSSLQPDEFAIIETNTVEVTTDNGNFKVPPGTDYLRLADGTTWIDGGWRWEDEATSVFTIDDGLTSKVWNYANAGPATWSLDDSKYPSGAIVKVRAGTNATITLDGGAAPIIENGVQTTTIDVLGSQVVELTRSTFQWMVTNRYAEDSSYVDAAFLTAAADADALMSALPDNTALHFQAGLTDATLTSANVFGSSIDGNLVFTGSTTIVIPAGTQGYMTRNAAGNINVVYTTVSTGLILTSPNGTRYELSVDNSGGLITTAI